MRASALVPSMRTAPGSGPSIRMELGWLPMPSAVFKSKRHDTGVSPVVQFTPPVGVSWDLQEAGMTVKFIMRLPTSPTPKVNSTATVTGAWEVRYDPISTDVDTIGSFDVEVEALRSNGKK